MTDTPSSILLLRLQSVGSNTNLWGGYLNTALSTLEQASKGYQALAVTASATISWTNYSTGNSLQCAFIKLTGALSSAVSLTAPAYNNFVMVWNNTGAQVTILCSGGVGVAIPTGRRTLLFCDGVDYYTATPDYTAASITLTNNGDIPNYSQVQTLIANASTITSPGQIKNSASDTTDGYLSQKFTIQIGTLTTTQVSGLTTVTLATVHAAGNEQSLVTISGGYAGGFLPGGNQSSQFTPAVGTEYNCDFTASSWTVNLGGMTTPQIGQRIKLNCFGNNGIFLLGTVNGQSNLSLPPGFTGELSYSSASWGWN